MRIGALALVGIVLILVGVVLHGEADLAVGGWIAMSGLTLALLSIALARRWLRKHGDEEHR
jgi:hypothetical protein